MRFDPKQLGKPPGAMSEAEFIDAFGHIYECSPWVAREAWRRGLGEDGDSLEGVARALAATVDAADDDTKLDLIRAHPDLAGRAAVRGELGEASTREQAGAGIDQCSPAEYERFQTLNAAYKEKFGFPFVMAVKGSDREAILSAFEERLENNRDTEFQRAIAEIHRIARFRLREMSDD
ncbi:MAG TPA: 2-oxo-4-hydroxy-4-carboxy-5-ureidoimidazoline decarboxylase [Arenicellales bacterium]|nr:2-oxo-4-hydroxy-4-carboxy-5-ureidoimidazoline decarboxylase [Arenicellales bacterium]